MWDLIFIHQQLTPHCVTGHTVRPCVCPPWSEGLHLTMDRWVQMSFDEMKIPPFPKCAWQKTLGSNSASLRRWCWNTAAALYVTEMIRKRFWDGRARLVVEGIVFGVFPAPKSSLVARCQNSIYPSLESDSYCSVTHTQRGCSVRYKYIPWYLNYLAKYLSSPKRKDLWGGDRVSLCGTQRLHLLEDKGPVLLRKASIELGAGRI